MKKRLSRISPLQLGVVLAALYGLLSLIIVVPMGAFFFARSAAMPPNFAGADGSVVPVPHLAMGSAIGGGLMMMLMPFLYAAMGFVLGVISGVVYNLVAKWTGGIEFTVVDAPEP